MLRHLTSDLYLFAWICEQIALIKVALHRTLSRGMKDGAQNFPDQKEADDLSMTQNFEDRNLSPGIW